jgi:hypothetical protein
LLCTGIILLGVVSRLRRAKSKAPALQKKLHTLRFVEEHRKFLIRRGLSPAPDARGIAAESPQDLHWQIRGLEAESPVFFVRLRTKKTRPNFISGKSFFLRGYNSDFT